MLEEIEDFLTTSAVSWYFWSFAEVVSWLKGFCEKFMFVWYIVLFAGTKRFEVISFSVRVLNQANFSQVDFGVH